MTMSSDLIYDVLRKHEPEHILLRATRAEAAGGLTDISRIGTLLARANGHIRVRRLDHGLPPRRAGADRGSAANGFPAVRRTRAGGGHRAGG
jgi:Lhr-like helicase